MNKTKLRNLKRGEMFRLRDSETANVWIKGEYVREGGLNRYSCTKFDDTNHEKHMCGDMEVFYGFTF